MSPFMPPGELNAPEVVIMPYKAGKIVFQITQVVEEAHLLQNQPVPVVEARTSWIEVEFADTGGGGEF